MSVPVVVLPQSRASTIRRRLYLTNHRSSALERIALGILFALLMQFRPFRSAVYALLGWGAFMWVQDWWSEHSLPDDTPALAWSVEEATAQPVFSTGNPTWHVTVRAVNRGTETIQGATLQGTLYECPEEQPVRKGTRGDGGSQPPSLSRASTGERCSSCATS